jgi:probable F420-dependent oxidoreductase
MKIEASLMAGEYTETGAAAKQLEDLGFDTAIAFEGPHDPFMGLVLAAQATEKIQLATGVAIAFARNPMVVAQTANDLQRIAKGRFILGLGTQIKPHIEKRFSMPWSKPAARMREFVHAIRAIWASWEDDERLDFHGEFYTHTLMTPVFIPKKNPHGLPPIFLAAVGPKMVEVAGEVADGFIAHPLNSRAFALESLLPTLEQGLATGGRKRKDFEISIQTITIVGDTDEQIEKGRQQAKTQLSFYGSTPAYRVPLDFHGWGDIQPRLNRMSKEGKWLEMVGEISDELVDTMCVSGKPSEIGSIIQARNDFADRTTLTLYNMAGPDALQDVVASFKR